MILYALIFVTISLQPFFEFFRPGDPYQLAAIKELEDSLPEELLEPDAEWFQTWKQSGLTQRLVVPYHHQLDHHSGRGYRMCFTASASMVSAYYGATNTQEEYSKIREKHGDTIYAASHVDALRELGLNASFRDDADDALVEAEIASGRPVMAGILHHGDLIRDGFPICDERGCGHWLVIVGFDKDHWIVHDPMGQLDMEHGGHFSKYGGKSNKLPRVTFRQRWQIEGPRTGWVILVSDE